MKESAFGARLEMGDGESPENFTEIAGVGDISGPGFTLDLDDVTAHDSPGAFEEMVAGIIRTGQITFGLRWDPQDETHDASTGLLGQLVAREARNYQFVIPGLNGLTWLLKLYVTGFQPQLPVNGARAADVTTKVTGQPTLVEAS